MLGLPNGVVTIVPWNREWSSYFEQERKSILNTMKDHHVIVHHIGSTAIKHLDAKPVLDIAIEVENFSVIEEQVQLLEQLGYHCMGDQSCQTVFISSREIPGRIKFISIVAEALFYKNS